MKDGRMKIRFLELLEKLVELLDDVFKALLIETGIDADEEAAAHNIIGNGQIADGAMFDILVGGLFGDITRKNEARFDPVQFEEAGNFVPHEWRVSTHQHRESKP